MTEILRILVPTDGSPSAMRAVEHVIEAGYRTVDLRDTGKETVGTREMGRLIAEAIKNYVSEDLLNM